MQKLQGYKITLCSNRNTIQDQMESCMLALQGSRRSYHLVGKVAVLSLQLLHAACSRNRNNMDVCFY